MGANERKFWQYVPDLLFMIAAPALAYYLARQIISRLDPDAGAKAEAQQKALAATSRLQSIFSNHDREEEEEDEYSSDSDHDSQPRSRSASPTPSSSEPDSRRRRRRRSRKPRKSRTPRTTTNPRQNLTLNTYEQAIAMELVSPLEIPVTFADIGGLDTLISELQESVIYPLTMPNLYAAHSSLLTAPSGVLLYGPPGCGKTMLAKALARESGACFINLHISTLTEKWYGDSNKLVAAVFSLARKLQPSIVFIDEIDAVLGTRGRGGEHEASGMVKAEFMTHWDGLASATTGAGSQRICILGATNRIGDIDEAILRRMPKKFAVPLPAAEQRRRIFELTLRDTRIDTATYADGKPVFDLDVLVRLSAGMSGSDIKEACRDAAMVPVREYIRASKESRGGSGGGGGGRSGMKGIKAKAVRGLQTDDFFGRRRDVGVPASKWRRGSGSTEEVEEFDDVDDVGREGVVDVKDGG